MNALIFLTIIALASPIYAEEAVEAKKQEKRGLLGLGYGGYYGGLGGLSGYGGHGYLGAPVYSALSHGVAAAPVSHAYSAPISVSHGYSAPVLSAPALHVGSGSLGLQGHGVGYVHGW